jgi:hypothetical protein
MKPWRRMTSPLESLVGRVLTGPVPAIGSGASATICGHGVELPVVVNGLGQQLLYVGHASPAADAFASRELLVLRIVLEEGGLRVDLPVELVAPGRASMVLRMLPSPLVLRRRMVRDQGLADAVGGQPRRGTATPLVA